MNILLLTEGNLIEDKIILSRIKSEFKVDKSILSKNVWITNFFKYDLIIISFVPSFGTPHFRLIESLLKLNKIVISMNMDQNNFYFDYFTRSKSFENLCKLGLKLFVIDENFDKFISKLNLYQSKLKINNFISNDNKQSNDSRVSDNLVFIFDFRWPTASNNYLIYKNKVGYTEAVLRSALKYSTSYMECVSFTHDEVIEYFHFKNLYIYIDSFATSEEIKIRFDGLFEKNAEIIDAKRIIELIEENSIILTNWHCIELIKYKENLKIFRLKFNYQKDINYFKEIPLTQYVDAKFLDTLDKFEIDRIKSNMAIFDISKINYRSNKSKIIGVDRPITYLSLIIDAIIFIFSSTNLLVVQLRFATYNLKNIIKFSVR